MDWERADKAEAVLTLIEEWMEKHNVNCLEAIYQVDRVNESLPELVEELVKQVGFKS